MIVKDILRLVREEEKAIARDLRRLEMGVHHISQPAGGGAAPDNAIERVWCQSDRAIVRRCCQRLSVVIEVSERLAHLPSNYNCGSICACGCLALLAEEDGSGLWFELCLPCLRQFRLEGEQQ